MRIGLSLALGLVRPSTGEDTTAPSRLSIAVNSAGTKVIVTFDEALDAASVPALGDFSFAGAAIATLTGTPAIVGSTVELSLSGLVNTADAGMTLSYTPGTNKLRDAAGNLVAGWTTQAVTNGSSHVYDPRDEGGAVLWISTEDPANYTLAGGFLTAEKNLITGNNLIPVPTTGVGVPFEATGLNGKPCAHATSTTHIKYGTDAAVVAALTESAPYTLVVYGSLDAVDNGNTNCFFGAGTDAAGTRPQKRWGSSTTGGGRMHHAALDNGTGTIVVESTADNTSTSGLVHMFWSSGTTLSYSANNGTANPNAAACDPAGLAGTCVPTKFSIDGKFEQNPGNPWNGRRTEMWLFDSALGSAARARVVSYLRAKWD